MPYDVITGYHGTKARLPKYVSCEALQHHYDMCCIENMAAKKQIVASLRGIPAATLAVLPSSGGPPAGDPARKTHPQVDVPDNRQGSGVSGGAESSPHRRQPTEQVPTPPSSDQELGRETVWRIGCVYFTDAQEAERKRREGWNVIKVDSEEEDSDDSCSSSDEERGRPRKRRCIVAAKTRLHR